MDDHFIRHRMETKGMPFMSFRRPRLPPGSRKLFFLRSPSLEGGLLLLLLF